MSRADQLMERWQRARLADQDGFLAGVAHATPKMPWWNVERVQAMLDLWAGMDRTEQDRFLQGVIL